MHSRLQKIYKKQNSERNVYDTVQNTEMLHENELKKYVEIVEQGLMEEDAED